MLFNQLFVTDGKSKKLVSYNTIKITKAIILLQGFSEHLLCAARLLLRQPRFV
jgi:hypothetical protein